GDGGLASSARALACFTEALLSGGLVPRARLREMVTPGPRRHLPGYGLGLVSRRDGAAVVAGHDGFYLGWTASTGMDDATGTTVAAVANLGGVRIPAARIAAAARRALAAA
ncbi:MAG TPA: serine hydrolase, partial [Solirubrobacteraceae bacterium]|nr:serine hydrolase [Solirubrobacteraceae bacterium]